MKKFNRVVIHHSASEWGCAMVIDQWHKSQGWSGIGYHFVILNGFQNYEDYAEKRIWTPLIGSVEVGRPFDLDFWVENNEIGAHALGFNAESLGICLIHDKDGYSPLMIDSLFKLSRFLIEKFPILTPESFQGHYELEPKKPSCPSIDMKQFRSKLAKKPFWIF